MLFRCIRSRVIVSFRVVLRNVPSNLSKVHRKRSGSARGIGDGIKILRYAIALSWIRCNSPLLLFPFHAKLSLWFIITTTIDPCNSPFLCRPADFYDQQSNNKLFDDRFFRNLWRKCRLLLGEIDGRICRILVSNELSEKCFLCFMFFPDLLTGNFRLRKLINRIRVLW